MGRVRSTLRFIFSIGGNDGISPIAKESETNSYLRQIADNTSQPVRTVNPPAKGTYYAKDPKVSAWRADHVPASREYQDKRKGVRI